MLPKLNTCQDCWELDPPPDMILTIPPPPMPTFFTSSFMSTSNRSNVPCSLLCDWTTGQGMEMIEELQHTGNDEENSWFLLTVSSFIFILLLSLCTTLCLLKCRQSQKLKFCLKKTTSTYSDRTYESILYPSLNNNHISWTTLTKNGKPQTVAVSATAPPLPPRVSQKRRFEGRPEILIIKNAHPNIGNIALYPSLKCNNYPSLL